MNLVLSNATVFSTPFQKNSLYNKFFSVQKNSLYNNTHLFPAPNQFFFGDNLEGSLIILLLVDDISCRPSSSSSSSCCKAENRTQFQQMLISQCTCCLLFSPFIPLTAVIYSLEAAICVIFAKKLENDVIFQN